METFHLYSRNHNLCEVIINAIDGTTLILSHNVDEYQLIGTQDDIEAIDPNGGPYVHRDMIFRNDHHNETTNMWQLKSIDFFLKTQENLLIIHGRSQRYYSPHPTTETASHFFQNTSSETMQTKQTYLL